MNRLQLANLYIVCVHLGCPSKEQQSRNLLAMLGSWQSRLSDRLVLLSAIVLCCTGALSADTELKILFSGPACNFVLVIVFGKGCWLDGGGVFQLTSATGI